MSAPARAAVASDAVASDIDPAPPSPVAAVARAEATLRALVTGALIGVVLAAGNVYTSLKVSIIDGGSITAALLGFGTFALFRRSRTPYSALENNITQTTASSAAVMSFVTGVVGPIPALALMGTSFSSTALVVFGAAIGVLGVFVAALLRRRLVVEEALPFPTGLATGEVIVTMFGARQAAVRRVVLLLTAAGFAAAITWFRDARPALIPQGFMFGGTIAGVSAAAVGLGFSCSPLMLATGAVVGLRAAAGLLLGAIVARIALAPWLVNTGIVVSVELGALNQWLVWPALGLLLAGSFVPLLLDGGAIVRAFRQLVFLGRRSPDQDRSGDPAAAPRLWAPLLVASVAAVLLVGWAAFDMGPLVTLVALVLALLLANVSARATGETDFSPGGSAGTVSLIALSGRGAASGVMGGGMALGMTSQTSQTLWAFRAGHRLGASPRAQVGAQILGVLVGAIVTVPVYAVVAAAYGIGNDKMPAVSALSWKATAQAMHGLAALPPGGGTAVLLGLGTGIVLTLLGRARIGRFLPSAAVIGVGFMLPFSLILAAFAGALLLFAARRLFRDLDQASAFALAAGGIAGESVIGVIIAILMATGVL